MAATFIRTPKQPTSPNEHRTPGLSRHLWSAAPAQPLLNLGPAVLSRDPSPIRNAAAPPMPHRLDSKKKKKVISAALRGHAARCHAPRDGIAFQVHRRSSHNDRSNHRLLRRCCQSQSQSQNRSPPSTQGHAPPRPSSQVGGCKRPRQRRTRQKCPSPTRGQATYAARW